MTMICKYCKIEVQEDSNFCNKCGAKVHREAKCPNIINDVVCDTLISSNESVCPHCNWSITEKAFETGTRMCNAFKDEMPCKHLVAQEDDCCSKCGSIRETLSKTDKSEDLNSSECNAGKVVDSDFCLTDEKDKSDTNNTITKEGQNEETPKEFTANCESGVNKIADYTPLTLDEKTKSDKHEKNEEFESNFHSVNDANMSENESIRTNIHRQREDEIQSYLQHVSKSKKENENNSESNLQAAGKTIYHPEEGLENQALPMVPNPTQNKVTDDVESKGNINAKGNERDTTIYEEGGKQSADGIKLNYSEEAEPICQGNIAEETIDEIRNPDNTYSCSPPIGHFHQTVIKSRTENKYDDSSRQDGTESNEGSSVDQFTQNTGKKDNGGTVMQASPRGPNPIQYKVTDDVRSGDNMNSKAKEHDTGNREETGNQSEDGIKLTYSEEAEPSSQGNIAVKKHFVHGNSSRQEGMESKEGSSVDQFTQNTGKKDIGGAEMQTLSSMPNLIQNNLENVDGITIVFHAEASDPFLKGPCVKFGIAFENPYKGSKWCYYPGEIERNISDKSWLISVTVRFERKLLCQGVCYQYYRYPDNETDLCEFGDYYAVKMSFRRLKLTREDSSRDKWHQHDGILYPTYATTPRPNYYKSKILQDIQAYILHCCPIFCYEVHVVPAPEILQNIDMMYRSLENTCCYRFNECRASDDLEKSLLAGIRKSVIQFMIQRNVNQMTLCEAMLLLCVSMKYSVNLESENKEIIYRSFLLDHNADKEIKQYKMLTEEYSENLSQCKEALRLAIFLEQKSDDPIWMCSLPVYHFLTHQCKPFQNPQVIYEHSTENYDWGTSGIQDTIDYLKAKTNWARAPQYMLHLLTPMFEMDYLLPRSFVAVLNVERFDSTVCEKKIPMDAVLAGIHTFLKTDIIFKSDKVGIHSLKTVSQEILALHGKAITEVPRTMAYFTLKISRDILKETLLKFRKMKRWHFVLSVIEMYFTAESLSAKYCFDSHKEFEKCLSEVVKCFDDLKLGDKDSIKVWNSMLEVQVLHEKLMGSYLNEIKGKMEMFLLKKVKFDLYCVY